MPIQGHGQQAPSGLHQTRRIRTPTWSPIHVPDRPAIIRGGALENQLVWRPRVAKPLRLALRARIVGVHRGRFQIHLAFVTRFARRRGVGNHWNRVVAIPEHHSRQSRARSGSCGSAITVVTVVGAGGIATRVSSASLRNPRPPTSARSAHARTSATSNATRTNHLEWPANRRHSASYVAAAAIASTAPQETGTSGDSRSGRKTAVRVGAPTSRSSQSCRARSESRPSTHYQGQARISGATPRTVRDTTAPGPHTDVGPVLPTRTR